MRGLRFKAIYAVLFLAGAGLAVSLIISFFMFSAERIHPEPDLGGVYEQMYSAGFWVKSAGNEVILSAKEVSELNSKLKNDGSSGIVDLYGAKDSISKEELLKRIEVFRAPNGNFFTGKGGGVRADEDFYDRIADNRNIKGIKSDNAVLKAVVVNETEVRDFPTGEPLFVEEGKIEIDMFCENRMYVWEKCLVLHTSLDGKWRFIEGDSFSGWIRSFDVAVCGEEDWRSLDAAEQLTVVGSYAVTDYDPYESDVSERKLSMGTRLPLCDKGVGRINEVSTISSYVAYMPFRNKDGRFYKKAVRIPKSGNVHIGYLPMTGKNILIQAFKLLGERYGWGGSYAARDCSAYVRDVYRCFGIELPKNSAMQGGLGVEGRKDLSKLSDDEKERAVRKLSPGAILEMPGHVMLYIGEYGGKAYVIHDVYAFGEKGAIERTVINCVTISDLHVVRNDGSSFLSNIRSAVELK